MMNKWHGKTEKLTMRLVATVAASGKVFEARFVIGGELERENAWVRGNPLKSRPNVKLELPTGEGEQGAAHGCVGVKDSTRERGIRRRW